MDRRTMMIGTALAAICAAARTALPKAADNSKPLNALFDRFMKENLDLSPLTVTNLGMDTGTRARQKYEIDDGSEAGIERQKALIASQLARLTAFDRGALRVSDVLSYDVIMYGLRTTDAANRAFRYGPSGAAQPYVLCQKNGGYQQLPAFLDTQHIIETKADTDAYPLGHIGQLQASLYRAVRLVVDAGLHSKQWTREQAVRSAEGPLMSALFVAPQWREGLHARCCSQLQLSTQFKLSCIRRSAGVGQRRLWLDSRIGELQRAPIHPISAARLCRLSND